MVSNAREAIKLAKEVIEEAGYITAKIIDVEYDENEELWTVHAQSGQTEIELTITEDDDVKDFTTN